MAAGGMAGDRPGGGIPVGDNLGADHLLGDAFPEGEIQEVGVQAAGYRAGVILLDANRGDEHLPKGA